MAKSSKIVSAADPVPKQAVIYAQVSSKEQEKEGFSIPAQLKLLKEYAAAQGFTVAQEYIDVETAARFGPQAQCARQRSYPAPAVPTHHLSRGDSASESADQWSNGIDCGLARGAASSGRGGATVDGHVPLAGARVRNRWAGVAGSYPGATRPRRASDHGAADDATGAPSPEVDEIRRAFDGVGAGEPCPR